MRETLATLVAPDGKTENPALRHAGSEADAREAEGLRAWIREHRVCWELIPRVEVHQHERVRVGFDLTLLARHPEQADRYYEGLRNAEVPSLRRVRAQEFSFRPGIEVTDIRQVKGLEFDYVVMLDVNAASFGTDDESRHLFHIGVTRAAHQLWLIVTATPSPLFPPELLSDSPG